MSELESRLRDALAAQAESVEYLDLAGGARERLRRRRGTRGMLAVAAAVVVVLAVMVPVALGRGGTFSPSATSAVGTAGSVGWRTESWHDVTMRVPASWGYSCPGPVVARGSGLPDCDSSATPLPAYVGSDGVAFERISGMRGEIDHLQLASGRVYDATTDQPIRAMDGIPGRAGYVGVWFDADTFVEVRDEDRATVQAVLDSIRRFRGADPNGCYASRTLIPAHAASSDGIAVCRYNASTGALEQSERLTGAAATAATAALLTAPPAHRGWFAFGGAAGAVSVDWITSRGVVSINGTGAAAAAIGITGAFGTRGVTRDVLYWALSPGWSGALPAAFAPNPLRTLGATPSPLPTSVTITATREASPSSRSGSFVTPAGWRTESWHGVTLAVPGTWPRDDGSDWCAGDIPWVPRVYRPGAKCTLAAGGVAFSVLGPNEDLIRTDTPVRADGGWSAVWVGGARGDGVPLVRIADRDRVTVQKVMDSIHETDPAPGG
jgi:hypothetical protein